MVSYHHSLPRTTPYSYPLTPPVSVYSHSSWEEVDQTPLCCVLSGGLDQGDDETSLDATIYRADGGLSTVSSMTTSSAFKPVSLDPGPSTYASMSQNFILPSVQPGFVASQPVIYSTTGPRHAVPVTAAPASPKGKAKMDMNLAPAGSEPATAGFQTPLAAHVATLAVWIWYSEYDPESLAAVGTRPTIPPDLFDIETESRPINPSQLNPTPAFVAHVAHILQTTMVSHSVMVIALLYIYRLKRTNPIVAGPGSEFRPFIASLILSNKFLDDNTYTNKTWSELTQLSVKEIGDMEIEFLNGLNYSLKVEHSEYVHWRHVLDGFMLANQRIRRPVPLAWPQQSVSPAQPLAHLLSPVPALSLQSLPRAKSASPAYTGPVQLPPMGAYVFPPASPTHARKRSAEAAFIDAGAPPTSSAIYEAMRHSARKALAHVDPTQWVPVTVANTPDSNVSGSVKRASSLNRKIARLPAEGGSRRGSHSNLHMSQGSLGTINPAAMAAPVMADQFTWRQMQRTGPEAYQALIAPCVAAQPVYVPPEHMVYYELAATPHLGPDGQFRKARMRYQANPNPSQPANPLQPINPNTYGMNAMNANIVPAAPAPTPAMGLSNPAMSLAPTPASSSALMFDPYAGQLAPYTLPLQDASSYSQPVPGQFANAGPPGWMYDPSPQGHMSAQSAQWGTVAPNGSDMALSASNLQLQLQQYQQQQQQSQHQQVPMTASAAYHPNRLSTGSEELFGLDSSGLNMSGADLDSAWRTRSEWSSPMPGWGGQPHDREYRQAAYTHQAPPQ